MGNFVCHLEAAIDGTVLPADCIQTMHRERPLWVRYDLAKVGEAVHPTDFAGRPKVLWRYQELLPVPDQDAVVSLGEGMTPLLAARKLGEALGLAEFWIKDESTLPTGSFKSRGMAMAVSMAKHFGLTRLAAPTAGNAGGALAAYGARAGMEVYIFMPVDTPGTIQRECVEAGAKVYLVDGLITDCGRIVREGRDTMGWFDMATLKEPYRIEGKKTMGLELAEQLGWRLPDVILYPTGGGTGLIGMWKAFNELRELGWLQRGTMPRMISVQSDGCAPIARAFEAGERFAEPWESPNTKAWGIRVPGAVGDFMILDAVRESEGLAVAVPDDEIEPVMNEASEMEGISICPETAACIVAARRLLEDGRLSADERVVLFNTASALKYAEAEPLDLPCLPADAKMGDFPL
ncbi:MAG: threonine synthase [Phycisphaerales bacterium]|nr:threonine synthase [Phycisphaerales bacterium]